MDKKAILLAVQRMRSETKKRNFLQSIELMINFKLVDYKKQENQIDVRVKLPFATGKGTGKTLLFAKTQLFAEQAKGKVDKIIMDDKIPSLPKKEVSEILNFDLLLAEGPAMLTVGKYLGQQLAPRGRMPKPVQPTMQSLQEALKEVGGALRVTNKKGKPMPLVQTMIGDEKMTDEQLSENAFAVVTEIASVLPAKSQNIRSVFVKETMGPSIKVGEKGEAK